MASPKNTTPNDGKPFQFSLRSIFVATSAVAVALGVLNWVGPRDFFGVVFFTTPLAMIGSMLLLRGKGRLFMAWAWCLLLSVALVIAVLSQR